MSKTLPKQPPSPDREDPRQEDFHVTTAGGSFESGVANLLEGCSTALDIGVSLTKLYSEQLMTQIAVVAELGQQANDSYFRHVKGGVSMKKYCAHVILLHDRWSMTTASDQGRIFSEQCG